MDGEYLTRVNGKPTLKQAAATSAGAADAGRLVRLNGQGQLDPSLGGGGGGGGESFGFHSGDASPINLGAAFTGLLSKVRVCVEVAFTGLLRFEVGSDSYEFPGDVVTCYEVYPTRRCVNEQPRLALSGLLVGESGSGFVQLIKLTGV